MAERLSALAHLPAQAASGAALRLAEVTPRGLFQIQAWPETLATVDAVVTQALGLADMPEPGWAMQSEHGALAAIGAGRFLVLAKDDGVAVSFRTAFSSLDATVTEITHGRTVLTLEGDAAGELLMRCAPVDFDAAAFPIGRVAQTAIHHVDILVRRCGSSKFEIWALRSFAESLAEWLLDAGAELGVRFVGGGD